MYGIAWRTDNNAFHLKDMCFYEEIKPFVVDFIVYSMLKIPNWLDITSLPSYIVNVLLEYFLFL